MYNAITSENADVITVGHFQDDGVKIKDDTFFYDIPVIKREQIFDQYVLPVIGKIYAGGYVNYPGYVWGRLYRKSCITDECFVSEREVYTEDDLFQMYLSRNIQKAVFLNEKMYYYRQNSASLTHVYRQNMWEMLKKRHQLVMSFLKENGRTDNRDRIWASAFYAVYVSVTNAYNLRSYFRVKEELKTIRNDSFTCKVLRGTDKSLLRPRQLLFYRLFYFRFYFGVFLFRNLLF
jgi:hypothetical protein